VASGVNNAIARTASLTSLALIPVVSGLTQATDPQEVTDSFRTSLLIAAVIAAAAAPISYLGLARPVRTRRSAREVHCSFDAPPLQPDPDRCPIAASG
jgi:hypothetical protein